MATTKKAAESAVVDYSTMNVFKKLQLARVRFLEAGVDKSGKHMKLEYKYFELADIVPKAEQIFLEIGLMMVPSMYGDKATARVYNVDDREDFIDFVAPYTPIAPIVSNAGSVENALEIYRERVEEKHCITISKNAIKNKSEMFVDLSGGGAKQVGYVITGKTEFDKGDYTGYSTQYIDLWVTILTVVNTVF